MNPSNATEADAASNRGRVERPETPDEAARIVAASERIVVVGRGTKPGPRAGDPVSAIRLDLSALSGILEYEPTEFTLTARAGTPLRELRAALEENGQYLPFDPPLVDAGASLGGTLACGLSGPGRVRFGGARDFVLGLRFVDGHGTIVRGGGKVVKNAAGFDFPKFFVGACGEFGAVLEWTVKVFPLPPVRRSFVVDRLDPARAVDTIVRLTTRPLDLDALDLRPEGERIAMRIRMAGEPESIERQVGTIASLLNVEPAEVGAIAWYELDDLTWCGADRTLVRVPTPLGKFSALLAAIDAEGADWRASAGGQLVWVSLPAEGFASFGRRMAALGLTGLTIRPSSGSPRGGRIGSSIERTFLTRVRQALDPQGRFGVLDA